MGYYLASKGNAHLATGCLTTRQLLWKGVMCETSGYYINIFSPQKFKVGGEGELKLAYFKHIRNGSTDYSFRRLKQYYVVFQPEYDTFKILFFFTIN